jgi:dCMP deaminase
MSEWKRTTHAQSMLLAASMISMRSTCLRRQVGCILTRNKIVVATGYNGSPPLQKHCIDVGCLIESNSCVRCIHAEMNAALRCGGAADSAYCTDQPCLRCMQALVGVGVKEIFYLYTYSDRQRDVFVEEMGVQSYRVDQVTINMCEAAVLTTIEVFSAS